MAEIKKRMNKNGQIEYYDAETGQAVNSQGTTGTTTTTINAPAATATPSAEGKSKNELLQEYKEAKRIATCGMASVPYMSFDQWLKNTYNIDENTVNANRTTIEKAEDFIRQATGGRVDPTIEQKESVPQERRQQAANGMNAVTGGQITGTNTPASTSESGGSNDDYVSNINMDAEEPGAKPMEVNESNIDEWAQKVIDRANEGAKADVEKDNLIESESEDLSKLRDLYKDIPDYGIEGLPSTIMQAYRSGLLGEVGSKDAETARNQLVLNQIFNTLGNMGAAWQGKEGTQSLWDTKTAKDWEAATERKNEKFKTQMEQQLNLSNLAAEDQEKARAAIKELSTDAYFQRAAQQLNNIEDTLGLFELKKAIGNEWGKMDKASKQNVLAAYQLVANGNIDAAQNAVNSMPRSEQEKVGNALLDAQLKQAVANGNLTAAQAALVNKTAANYDADMALRMVRYLCRLLVALVASLSQDFNRR